MADRLKNRAQAAPSSNGEREVHIPLEKLVFDPNQPRKRFHAIDGQVAEEDLRKIKEMAESIKEQGLIQAITVEELPDGTFKVITGERRARAHLLLGEKTIRSKIKNDLTRHSARLLYQTAENVNRDDLTDLELAGVIKELLEGSENEPKMTQTAIAKALGKSEGWITRFVAFGDEELQRRWVHSGITDNAEHVYRLKLLPQHIQLEILRRVDLPADDLEFIAKPITRSVVLDFEARAKREKNRDRQAKTGITAVSSVPPVSLVSTTTDAETTGGEPESGSTSGWPSDNDPIGQALAEAAENGRTETTGADAQAQTTGAGTGSGTGSGYTVPDDVRASILAQEQGAAEVSAATRNALDSVPPVKCRVTVMNLEGLLPLLKTNPGLLKSVRNVRCEMSLPGELAKEIASALTGVVVADQELPATVQNELAKL
jgi:ParB/RepB/Spo0J family partition protein